MLEKVKKNGGLSSAREDGCLAGGWRKGGNSPMRSFQAFGRLTFIVSL